MAEIQKTTILNLAEKTQLDSADAFVIDTASGTKKITQENLIDDTLEMSGKLADAKAVGDAIKAQKTTIDAALALKADQTALTAEATAREQAIAAEATAREEADAALKDDFSKLDPGLSDRAKAALLACFANVAWEETDGKEYYDELEAALQESTKPYIRAVFTPGEDVFFTDDSLNELKDNLVVSYYDGETTRTLNASEYGLSGVLAVGSNVITVSYSSYVTQFTVDAIQNLAPTLSNITYPDYHDGSIVLENDVLTMQCITDTEVTNWYVWAASIKTPKLDDVVGRLLAFRIKMRSQDAGISSGVYWYGNIFKNPDVTSMSAANRKSVGFGAPALSTEYKRFTKKLVADYANFTGAGSLVPEADSTVGILVYVTIKNAIDISQFKVGVIE